MSTTLTENVVKAPGMLGRKTLTDSERIAAQRKCVKRHFELEITKRDDRIPRILEETFVKDSKQAYYHVVPGMGVYDGLPGVLDFYELLFRVLPDLNLVCNHEYDVPGCSIREMIVTGTHCSEFAGVAASGKRIVFPVCALYIFGDDPNLLIAERAYWDNDTLLRQMRGESVVSTTDLPWDTTK